VIGWEESSEGKREKGKGGRKEGRKKRREERRRGKEGREEEKKGGREEGRKEGREERMGNTCNSSLYLVRASSDLSFGDGILKRMASASKKRSGVVQCSKLASKGRRELVSGITG
jgi:hypothetical protein